jgi:hypothetical protein
MRVQGEGIKENCKKNSEKKRWCYMYDDEWAT